MTVDQDPLPPTDVEDVKDGPVPEKKKPAPPPPPEKKADEDSAEQPS